jgi:hypothetical protein
MYDQSGNGCNATQATVANRPTLAFGTWNQAVEVASFTRASSQFLVSGACTSAGSYPSSFAGVARRTGSVTSQQSAYGSNSIQFGYASSANIGNFFNGAAISPTVSDSNNHSLIYKADSSGSSSVWIDGSQTTGGVSSGYPDGTHYVGKDTSNDYMDGLVFEVGAYVEIDLTSSATALSANHAGFY